MQSLILILMLTVFADSRLAFGTFIHVHPHIADRIEDEDSDTLGPQEGLRKSLPSAWPALEASVGLYNNADAAPIALLIRAARKSVDIEIYEMEDADVLAALLAAAQRQVHVRVIKDPDPVGQKCDPFPTPAHKLSRRQTSVACQNFLAWLRDFRATHGEFEPFRRATLCGVPGQPCFEHGKMILLDGRIAAISTGNFNATNLCDLKYRPSKCNRDYTYLSKDREVVKALGEIFDLDWKGDASALPAILKRGSLPRKLTVSPYSREPLVAFIRSARQKLQIQNQYITDEDFAAAILEAKAKNPGLKVEINLSDLCEYGSISDRKRYQARLMFQAFNDAGIVVKMFPKGQLVRGKKGYLHAKAIVVDENRAWIGSVNGSSMSLNRNREFGIYFSQPTRVKELAAQLSEDMSNDHALNWRKSVLDCPVRKHKNSPRQLAAEDDEG